MPLTVPELLAAVAIVMIAAAIQGAVGFGSALVAAPILVLIDPLLVPGPMLMAGVALTLLMMLRESRAIDWRGLAWALLGSLIGTGAGAMLVASVSREFLGLMLGTAVLTGVAASASGVRVGRGGVTLAVAGLLSGFMGTTTSAGGPPIALAYQDAPGPQIRATLSTYFTISAMLAISSLALVGAFGRVELSLGFLLLPGVVLGVAVSGRARPLLDGGYTRPAILLIAGFAAAAVVLRAVF